MINFKSKSFWLGFSINAVFWIGMNLFDQSSKPGITCFDCDKGFGKPFRIYESSTYCCAAHIVWEGLILNVVIVILIGIGLGAIFHSVSNRLFVKSLN